MESGQKEVEGGQSKEEKKVENFLSKEISATNKSRPSEFRRSKSGHRRPS